MQSVLSAQPNEVGVDSERLKRAVDVLKRGVDEGAMPGATVAAFRHGKCFLSKAVGTTDGKREAKPTTLYDLASITKPMATAASIVTLMEQGRLHLLTSLPALFGDAAESWKTVNVGHLLTHTSGLPAWIPLYKSGLGLESAVQTILAQPTEKAAAPGTHYTYSCAGYILLGRIIENVSGKSLDLFARENLFAPLELESIRYRPDAKLADHIAPTRSEEGSDVSPTDGKVTLCGTVHDGNARGIGGVSGNAGLFGTAEDVAKFGAALLPSSPFARLFGRPTLARVFANQIDRTVGGQSLLFFAPGNALNPTGDLLSPSTVGHSGFTGTVLTVDPEYDLSVAVLTNAVYNSGKPGWLACRRRFLNAVAAAIT